MRKREEPVWYGNEGFAFCSKVIQQLTRSTRGEREEVKLEIAAHLQDHTEALMERGFSQDEAAHRAAISMGDPVEIGRELNRSFSVFWLVMKRVFIVLFCAMLWMVLRNVLINGTGEAVLENLQVRLSVPREDFSQIDLAPEFSFELGEARRLNLKLESASRVVRLDHIAVGKAAYNLLEGAGSGYAEEAYCVCLSYTAYGKNPLDGVAWEQLSISGSEPLLSDFCDTIGGSGNGRYYIYEVEYGTEQIEVIWERYGQDHRVQLPLNWEGVS